MSLIEGTQRAYNNGYSKGLEHGIARGVVITLLCGLVFYVLNKVVF